MADDEQFSAFQEHVLADLHQIAKAVHVMAAQVAAMHAELEGFRPVLAMFRPGAMTAVQQAGVARAVRKRLGRGGA